MKKARLDNRSGQIILAHQYNDKAHGKILCCADPDCPAHMRFRRESLTHGAARLKEAHFTSVSAKEHRKGCTAYETYANRAKRLLSIETALAAGKKILINLNISLSDTFNTMSKTAHWFDNSSYSLSNYKTVGVKSVEDMLDCIAKIEEKGGAEALKYKCFVNYQGKNLPLSDFIVDTREKYIRLFAKLDRQLTQNPEAQDSVTDFPRLILFKGTQNSKTALTRAVRGTPVELKEKNRKLILLQKADVPFAFEKSFRGENLYVIAKPVLVAAEHGAMRQAAGDTAYLDLHWPVSSVQQFTPAELKPKS